MTWAEFRAWALEAHGFDIKGGQSVRDVCLRPVLGATGTIPGKRQPTNPSTGTGSGNYAGYGPTHQRRFAMWLRTRNIVEKMVLEDWLVAAETHADGWLVNDGAGIRWVADPVHEWKDLLNRGFLASPCDYKP